MPSKEPNGSNSDAMAMTNGSGSGSGSRLATPPPQPAEFLAQVDSLMQNLAIVAQNRDVLDSVRDIAKKNAELNAALEVNHGLISDVRSEKNGLMSDIQAKDARIAELEALVTKLGEKVASYKQRASVRAQEATKAISELDEEKAKVTSLAADKSTLARDKELLEGTVARQAAELAALQNEQGRLRAHADRLNGYALAPRPLPADQISARLASIFQTAYGIISTCFANDLPNEAFMRSAHPRASIPWDKFKVTLYESGNKLPLPCSNSAAAKSMRVAAVLRFLALQAQAQLFQPFYLLAEGKELGDVLYGTHFDDEDNAQHIDFVRRVLLRAEPQQLLATNIAARAGLVEHAMRKCLSGILSRETQDVTFAALGHWCDETAQVWHEHIQPLADVVHAYMDDDLDRDNILAGDWKVLAHEAAAEPKPLEGTNNIAAHVWPLFLVNGSIAQHGLVVTEADAADAKKEADAFATQQNSGHRMSRAMMRTPSAPSTPTSPTHSFRAGPSPGASGGGGQNELAGAAGAGAGAATT